MRPVVITQNGAGTSSPVPLDRYIAPFQVAIACAGSGGGLSYKVQYTYDDVFNVVSGSQTWFDDSSIPSGTATATAETTFDNPISAVRLVVAGGNVTMTVNQAGIV